MQSKIWPNVQIISVSFFVVKTCLNVDVRYAQGMLLTRVTNHVSLEVANVLDVDLSKDEVEKVIHDF